MLISWNSFQSWAFTLLQIRLAGPRHSSNSGVCEVCIYRTRYYLGLIVDRHKSYLSPQNSFRRRFSNCLIYFQQLVERSKIPINSCIESARAELFDNESPPLQSFHQIYHHPSDLLLESHSEDTRPQMEYRVDVEEHNIDNTTLPSVNLNLENMQGTPSPPRRPSPFLRASCPACFGGKRPELANSM